MNRFIVILFLSLIIFRHDAIAQNKNDADNIEKAALKIKDPHQAVTLLLAGASKFLESQPDQSLRLSTTANKIATRSGIQRDIALSLYYIGSAQLMQRNTDDGALKLMESIQTMDRAGLKNDTLVVLSLLKLSIIAEDSSDYFSKTNEALRISKKLNNPSLIAKSLIQLAGGYEKYYNDEKNILPYINSALEYAKESENLATLGDAYAKLGYYYSSVNDNPLALENLNIAVRYYKSAGSKSLAAFTLISISSIHKSIGNNDKAINATIESINLLEGTLFTRRLIIAYNELAVAYLDVNDFASATQYLKKAEKISETSGYDLFLYNTYGVYATMYTRMKQFQNAVEYAKKAIAECEKLEGPGLLMHAQNVLSELYYELRQYNDALAEAEKSLTNAKKFEQLSKYDITTEKAQIFYNMSRYTMALHDSAKSLKHALTGWNLLSGEGNYEIRYKLSYQLSELYLANDSLRKSLEFKNIAMSLMDSINQAEKTKLSRDLLSKYEIEKRDKEIALLNKERELQSLTLHERDQQLFSEKLLTESKERQLTIEKKEKLLKDVVLRKTEIELKVQKAQADLFEQQKKMNEAKNESQKQFLKLMSAGILLLLVSLISIFIAYTQKRKDNQIIAIQKKRSDELLLNILPYETAEELKQNGFTVARHFDDVSVMFTDFKDFSIYAGELAATDVVSEVDYCFKAFDRIIEKYNIEKIKTIGDAYMCAAGVPTENKNHAYETIMAAIEIRDFMNKLQVERMKEGRPFFQIRIGINSGPVVAGIVGLKKFAYDIWGDSVNIAARMEQHSEPGKINISGSTYEIVKDQFKCIYRGKINVKNKGLVDMYFIDV